MLLERYREFQPLQAISRIWYPKATSRKILDDKVWVLTSYWILLVVDPSIKNIKPNKDHSMLAKNLSLIWNDGTSANSTVKRKCSGKQEI